MRARGWLGAGVFAMAIAAAPAWADRDDDVPTADETAAGIEGPEGAEAGEAGEHAGHEGHELAPPHINWVDFSYGSKDAEGGKLDAGDERMSPPLVIALFNFVVLLWLLARYAWPKIKSYTRERSDGIQDALDESAKLRAEARAKLDECARRVANVDAEVDALVADIRAQAEAEKKRILAEAEAQAAMMKRDAEQRIAAELARARTELEHEVVNAAIAAAEKILRAKVGEPDQKTLVQGFIDSLEKSPAAASKEPS